MADLEEMKIQMLRLQAMVLAQQSLLLALFETHSDQLAALRVFLEESETVQGMSLIDAESTDDELQAEDTAHNFLAEMLKERLKKVSKSDDAPRRRSSK
ncbi:hypothetical protein [Paraburkholderia sp. BCC1885]|uniref:hypothetical protein n=1 Tax=Paraburkholderia sp. BCC1885 TaxID=2562669 RepID=UPI001182030E|nr:hypothetical protein [Paraburkholderia sp. BCC1885]